VTVEYALVLDSKGIREAVQENNPIKALNSFAFRDTFDGVDKPLVVFEISVTASVSVSAVIVKIGVSGGITIIIEFDFYDPNPATSGGLIRPFELINISPNPLDWFEVTIKAYATISFYVQVGIFLGFFDIILYEYRVEFNIIIIDALKITPKLKGRVATKGPLGEVTVFCEGCTDPKDRRLGSPQGEDSHDDNEQLTCKHMGGGSGDETVQCWQSKKTYPIIGYFEQVSSLVAPKSLELTINCIASAFDISHNEKVVLNYEQCKISSDAGLKIAGELVSATEGPITIRDLKHGTIILPTPAQDFLTVTIFQGCNARWTLHGDAALTVMGSQLGDDCMVEALDGKKESVLTVDLTSFIGACENADVAINLLDGDEPRGIVQINGVMRVKFNSIVYTDIVITDESVVDCNNNVHVMKLSASVKSVKISTSKGDDTIVIGTQDKPFEDFIHGNIDIDGGDGPQDKIIVHDGSARPKNQTLAPTLLSGIQARTNSTTTFFYKDIERIHLNLGGYVNAEVSAKVDLTISYDNSNSNKIHSTSMTGALNIISIGNSNETITVRNSKGPVTIGFGDGVHIIDISDSIGDVTIQTSDGNNNVSVHKVQGDLSINCLNNKGIGDVDHIIDISDSVGDVTIQTSGSKNDLSVHSVQGDLSIDCLNTGNDVGDRDNIIEISNSIGDVTIQTSGGKSDVSVQEVDGDLSIDCLNTGNDRIEVNLTKGDQKIATNAGNDTIIIHSVHRESMLTIIAGENGTNHLGNDNNYIKIDGLLDANALIIGGHGSDVIILNNATEVISMDESSSNAFQRDRSLGDSSHSASSYSLIVSTGNGQDALHVKTTPSCSMEIDTGDDNDIIHIYGLGFGTSATVLGGSGNDTLKIDGRDGGSARVKNTMDGTSLNWNGGLGKDMLETYFVSAGNSNLTLFGDSKGPNYVTIKCADIACVVLSRDTFLANM